MLNLHLIRPKIHAVGFIKMDYAQKLKNSSINAKKLTFRSEMQSNEMKLIREIYTVL